MHLFCTVVQDLQFCCSQEIAKITFFGPNLYLKKINGDTSPF